MKQKIRELTADEVEFVVECEGEHIPYKGNCSAIDEESDRKAETWIRNQLRRGNQWAWCSVKVTARWKGYEGHDYLGGCSYKSKDDFCQPGGYYDDMKDEALAELNKQLASAYTAVAELIQEV